MIVAKFGLISPVVSEEKIFVKVNDGRRRRRMTDAKWWEKLTWPFGPGELKMKAQDNYLSNSMINNLF